MEDPRVFLAAERTFLAWIRTGLALMGFGFVVARFGLFLGEMQLARGVTTVQPLDLSLFFGTGLVLLGVAVNVLSAARHARMVRQLNAGQRIGLRASPGAIAIALLLGAAGLMMTAYLIVTS